MLKLGGIETDRPQTVVWNPEVYDEIKEARERVADLEKQGYVLREKDDSQAILDPPKRDDNIGVFRILSQNGDDRLIWDRRDKEQVKEAFKKFKEYLKDDYTAYAVRSDGSRGHKLTEFDHRLEEIICGKLNEETGEREPAGEALLVPKMVPG